MIAAYNKFCDIFLNFQKKKKGSTLLPRNFIVRDKCPTSAKYCGTVLYKQGTIDENIR